MNCRTGRARSCYSIIVIAAMQTAAKPMKINFVRLLKTLAAAGAKSGRASVLRSLVISDPFVAGLNSGHRCPSCRYDKTQRDLFIFGTVACRVKRQADGERHVRERVWGWITGV